MRAFTPHMDTAAHEPLASASEAAGCAVLILTHTLCTHKQRNPDGSSSLTVLQPLH